MCINETNADKVYRNVTALKDQVKRNTRFQCAYKLNVFSYKDTNYKSYKRTVETDKTVHSKSQH